MRRDARIKSKCHYYDVEVVSGTLKSSTRYFICVDDFKGLFSLSKRVLDNKGGKSLSLDKKP